MKNFIRKISYTLLAISVFFIVYIISCIFNPFAIIRPPRVPEYKSANFLRAKISALNTELKSKEFYLKKIDDAKFLEEHSYASKKVSLEVKMRKTYSINEGFPVFLLGELIKLQKDKFSFFKNEKNFRILKRLPPVDKDTSWHIVDALVVNLDDKGNFAFLKLQNNQIIIEKSYIKGEPFYSYIGLDENGKIIDPALEKKFLERLSLYNLDEATAIKVAKDFLSKGFYHDAIDLVDWQVEEMPDSFILKGDLPQDYTVKWYKIPKITVKGGDVYIKIKKSNGEVLNYSKNYYTNESR